MIRRATTLILILSLTALGNAQLAMREWSADYHEIIREGDPPLTRGMVEELGSIVAFAFGRAVLNADQMDALQGEFERIWDTGDPLAIALKAASPTLNHQLDMEIAAQPAAIDALRAEWRRVITEEAMLRPDGPLGRVVLMLGGEVRVYGMPMGMLPRPQLTSEVMEAMCRFVATCYGMDALDVPQRELVRQMLNEAWEEMDVDETWAMSQIALINEMIEVQIQEEPDMEESVREHWLDVLNRMAAGDPEGPLAELLDQLSADSEPTPASASREAMIRWEDVTCCEPLANTK